MNTMTCRQLGGACEKAFHADTFEEMAELSAQHAMEMIQKQDARHLKSMRKMQALSETPDEMSRWFEAKRAEFGSLPED